MAELKNYASESQKLQFVLKGKAGLSVAKVFPNNRMIYNKMQLG